MEDMFATFPEILIVIGVLGFFPAAVLAALKAKTPLSRPGHVGGFFLMCGVSVLSLVFLRAGPVGVVVCIACMLGTTMLQMHFNARRHAAPGGSTWWFPAYGAGIGNMIIAFLPFFFASQKSVGIESGRTEAPAA